MAQPEPDLVAGLDQADPDRVAAAIAMEARTPNICVLLYEDLVKRDLLLETVEADLKLVWSLRTQRFQIDDAGSLGSFLESQGYDVALVTGLDDALDALGPKLNARRDAFAARHAMLWLSASAYVRFAQLAPDLSSYAVVFQPGMVGGLVFASALEPELAGLERAHGMSTDELRRKLRTGGDVSSIPEEALHRWTALARVLRPEARP